ncbi:MAG: hypothetical protein AAF404_01485 [Pseudomonadota bacterium]
MDELYNAWCNIELETYRSWDLAELFAHVADRLTIADQGDEMLAARLSELAQASKDAGV